MKNVEMRVRRKNYVNDFSNFQVNVSTTGINWSISNSIPVDGIKVAYIKNARNNSSRQPSQPAYWDNQPLYKQALSFNFRPHVKLAKQYNVLKFKQNII